MSCAKCVGVTWERVFDRSIINYRLDSILSGHFDRSTSFYGFKINMTGHPSHSDISALIIIGIFVAVAVWAVSKH